MEAILAAQSAAAVTDNAILVMANFHARWYMAWQQMGVPEHRASEWTEAMITAGISRHG